MSCSHLSMALHRKCGCKITNKRGINQKKSPFFLVNPPHSSFFTFHSSLFTLHFSLFTFHSSLFTLHFSLFTFHFSLFTFHFSLFTFHFSLLSYSTSPTITSLSFFTTPESLPPKTLFMMWAPFMIFTLVHTAIENHCGRSDITLFSPRLPP